MQKSNGESQEQTLWPCSGWYSSNTCLAYGVCGRISAPPTTKAISQSKTDPESGLFHKGEHEKQFAYMANTAYDRHSYIMDFEVVAGNIYDSMMFSGLYERVLQKFPEIFELAIDAGYKTPAIMK
jgi:hypothetical protein